MKKIKKRKSLYADFDFEWTPRQKLGLFIHKIYCVITSPAWWLFQKLFDL